MLLTSRSLLHRTASMISWWTSPDWSAGEAAPLPHTLETIAETAVAGGYSAAVSLGFSLPIKTPSTTAFGQANLETGTPADEDSLFRIGACTRQITAAAILLLAEQSRLRLSDRLDAVLPGEAGAGQITIEELLIADGAAYRLLGRVLEHVTGQIFADFVADALLLPAGMLTSRFAHPTQIIPHRAAGYRLAAERVHDFRNAGAGHINPAADGLYAKAREAMDKQAVTRYLDAVWAVVADANRYFAGEEPWAKKKTDPKRMETILYVTAEVVRQIAILATPVTPHAAEKLLDYLGQDDDAHTFKALGEAGRLKPGTVLPEPQGVFPRYIPPEAEPPAEKPAKPEKQKKAPKDKAPKDKA